MSNTSDTTPSTGSDAVAAGRWILDREGTTIALRHKGMWGLVTVKGVFNDVSGQGEVGADGAVRGSVTLAAASLDTGNAKRDEHLRSSDFFDTDRFPSLDFTVDSVVTDADGRADVSGELTVMGNARPLAFSARTTESTPTAVTLSAEVDIDRADYGLTWNKGGVIKGLATVALTVRFVHQPG
ncbi:YceI family protein [Streptomyces sp. NBC_01217]|uniref:YceI family protein n=1 Tax=Streptomyces sp. NBC_01217 TaxID=2903779 RepID=UPI002E1639A0|nr:YceI family protein [Streptomyces sp. NBC_01217]